MEFVATLLGQAKDQGFLGRANIGEQIDHSIAFADVVGSLITDTGSPGHGVVDLGSGGGLPGLVLAVQIPDVPLTMVEGSTRRAAWLADAVRTAGWADRVQVVARRAEEVGRDAYWRGAALVVTSRLFGRPAVVAECAAPLMGVGAHLVVSEPPVPPDARGASPDRWPSSELGTLGLEPALSVEARGYHFVTIRSASSCPDRYPRRTGIPEKRPLF